MPKYLITYHLYQMFPFIALAKLPPPPSPPCAVYQVKPNCVQLEPVDIEGNPVPVDKEHPYTYICSSDYKLKRI